MTKVISKLYEQKLFEKKKDKLKDEKIKFNFEN